MEFKAFRHESRNVIKSTNKLLSIVCLRYFGKDCFSCDPLLKEHHSHTWEHEGSHRGKIAQQYGQAVLLNL